MKKNKNKIKLLQIFNEMKSKHSSCSTPWSMVLLHAYLSLTRGHGANSIHPNTWDHVALIWCRSIIEMGVSTRKYSKYTCNQAAYWIQTNKINVWGDICWVFSDPRENRNIECDPIVLTCKNCSKFKEICQFLLTWTRSSY